MQKKLEKLKRISSVTRISIWVMLLLGLAIGGTELITSSEHRALFDNNLDLLWESGQTNKALLLAISMPTLFLFLLFAWKFQFLLKLFSTGTFFSEEVISSFKVMLWTKILGLFSPFVQTLMYAYLAKQQFGEADFTLEFNLWHVFTVIVLFTIFYLLNGAHQIEKENKEFV